MDDHKNKHGDHFNDLISNIFPILIVLYKTHRLTMYALVIVRASCQLSVIKEPSRIWE